MTRKRLTPNQVKWKNLIESRANMAVTSFPTYITQDMLTTLEIDLTEREKNAVNRDDVYIRELQSKLRYYSASIHPVTRYVVSELNEMTANMLAAYGRERVATMLHQAAEELEAEGEPLCIIIYKKESKNFRGKYFLTCSVN